MKTAVEIMRACCANEESRYTITIPFARDGAVWATDGRIMARVESLPGVELHAGKTPPVLDVWTPAMKLDRVSVDLPEPSPVPKSVECSECFGTCVRRCDMDHEHDCPACDGCGIMEPLLPSVAMQDGLWLAGDYLRLLWAFGVRTVYAAGAKKAVYWKADEVEGVVMPRTTPDDSQLLDVRRRVSWLGGAA